MDEKLFAGIQGDLKPLPQEIATLPEDETACQFCGVSYLLLHKYEAMQKYVKEMELELETLREHKTEHPRLVQLIKKLEQDQLKLTKESDLYKGQSERRERDFECKLASQKTEMDSIVASLETQRQNYEIRLTKVGTRYSESLLKLRAEAAKLASALVELKNDCGCTISSCQTEMETLIRCTGTLLAQSVTNSAGVHQGHLETLTRANRDLQSQVTSFKERLAALDANTKSELQLKAAEVKDLQDQLSVKVQVLANLSESLKSSEQIYAQTLKDKNAALQKVQGLEEALVAAKQSMAASGEDAVCALAKKEDQLLKANTLVTELRHKVGGLEKTIEETVNAHQSRVQQLQEKFNRELEAARKLQVERGAFELHVEREKFAKLQKSGDTQVSELRHQINSLQADLASSNSQNTAITERLKLSEQQHAKERVNLEAKLKELVASHEATKRLYDESATRHSAEVESLRQKVQQRQECPENSADFREKHELLAKLQKYDKVVLSLKETIKTQCEERIGLMALIDQYKKATLGKNLK